LSIAVAFGILSRFAKALALVVEIPMGPLPLVLVLVVGRVVVTELLLVAWVMVPSMSSTATSIRLGIAHCLW
jgi:hypothetical protein